MKTTVFLPLLTCLASAFASAEVHHFVVDPVHSNINFKIRHMQVGSVTGNFASFQGEILYDDANPENSTVEAIVQVASIDTNNADRDDHLNNEDFFNTRDYPVAAFESTQWVVVDKNEFAVTGDLTMMGKTLPVTFEVELIGIGEGRGGVMLSGWEAEAEIDRRQWGLTYGAPLAIGTDVELEIHIEAKKK